MLENFSAKGVPLWVTLVAIAFGFFGVVIGLITMIDPEFQNVPLDAVFLGHQLGGRTMGLGVVMLAAVGLRQRAGYLVGFIAGLFRDLGDVIAGFGDGPVSPIVPLIMMGIGIACIYAIVQATNQLMASEAHAGQQAARGGPAQGGRQRGAAAPPQGKPVAGHAPPDDAGHDHSHADHDHSAHDSHHEGDPKPITPPPSNEPQQDRSGH